MSLIFQHFLVEGDNHGMAVSMMEHLKMEFGGLQVQWRMRHLPDF
jgi:hypothetical protein